VRALPGRLSRHSPSVYDGREPAGAIKPRVRPPISSAPGNHAFSRACDCSAEMCV
jgi:hypothetical protein